MNISAVIFDLDNTILDTSSLKQIRESRNMDALDKNLDTLEIHDAANRLINFLFEENIKLGIVTNSPRWYAEKILKHFKIFDLFQSVVTYNEVSFYGIKPSPTGIKKVLADLQITDPSTVLYIGDEPNDVIASYNAGVLPVIGSWTNRQPLSDTPFGVLSYKLIKKHFPILKNLALLAENSAMDGCYSPINGEANFLPLDSNGNIISDPENLSIFCFGRYFSQKNEITARLHDNHRLSLDIFAKENATSSYRVPIYWNQIFSNLIKNISSYPKSKINHFDVVTVIPAKENKIKRLENMLEAIKPEHEGVQFLPELFYFLEGAPSLKSLPKVQRSETLKKYLRVNSKYISSIAGKNILILDDVITTGSTLKVSCELLIDLGANAVLGSCIAKTVSLQREFKQCPKCDSELILRKNHTTQARFWSCPKKNAAGQYCGHTESIKEKDCPNCGRAMYRKKNNSDGSLFLACSGYYSTPSCNYKESLEYP